MKLGIYCLKKKCVNVRNSVQKCKVVDFQVRRSEMISLQLVFSSCPFPVSSKTSVALLDAVDHTSKPSGTE